jgi:acyl-CoA thioester hydrolase
MDAGGGYAPCGRLRLANRALCARRTTCVIRSHFIEYLRPAFAGEALSLLTWIAGLNARSAPRRFLFWRESDRKIVAKAETLFVYVQAATGRPLRIPDALKNAFDVIADEADVLRTLGGDPPGPAAGTR